MIKIVETYTHISYNGSDKLMTKKIYLFGYLIMSLDIKEHDHSNEDQFPGKIRY